VWEWVNDGYGAYSADEPTNPQGPSTVRWRVLIGRVLRGGSCNDDPFFVRSSARCLCTPGNSSYSIGFRASRIPV